jgi:hypothetical protein
MKQLLTIFFLFVLTLFLAVGNALPALASSPISPAQNIAVAQTSATNSHQKEVQKHLVVQKLVCRYVNGYKRCWDE